MQKFNKIQKAVEDIKDGKFVIVVDDEQRENEGDLVASAQKITHSKVNFMLKFGRGLICVPVKAKRLDELNIPLMVQNNTEKLCTAFTVSVDLIKGTTTGISAFDRASTIRAIANPSTRAGDFSRPGHIFPLRAIDGGVLQRQGHTEASIELVKLGGLYPVAAICEILNDDGTMARLPQLMKFAKKHNLKIISIEKLIEYLQEKIL